MKSEIPMREYVICTILQDAMNCVFTEIMPVRNCLSQRLCRDAIYCVLQKHEFYIKKVRTKSTVASDN